MDKISLGNKRVGSTPKNQTSSSLWFLLFQILSNLSIGFVHVYRYLTMSKLTEIFQEHKNQDFLFKLTRLFSLFKNVNPK